MQLRSLLGQCVKGKTMEIQENFELQENWFRKSI